MLRFLHSLPVVCILLASNAHASPADDPFAPTIAVKSDRGRTIATCLGVMVAPRIGLTAGHCVSATAPISVHAATGGSKKVVAVDRFWTDPAVMAVRDGKVHTESSDIAILVLAEPLPMPAYARFARAPIDHSVWATGIRNAPTVLQALGITLRPVISSRRYYTSTGFAAPGDSGSPVFVNEGDESIVVGVLAGGNPGRELFARVDLVAHKIEELVASTAPPELTRAPRATPPVLFKPLPAKPPPPPPMVLPPANVTWT